MSDNESVIAREKHDPRTLELRTQPRPIARFRRSVIIAIAATGAATLFGITWWALSTFVRVRTGIMPDRPARQLVTFGPYRFSRNPMFVGFSAIYVGLAVLLNMVWPLAVLPLVIAVLTLTVIRHEERYMATEFGDPYQTYCRRVRRWM